MEPRNLNNEREPINIDADPINANWIRIIAATRKKRADDIVRLSEGGITKHRALFAIVKYHSELQNENDLPFDLYPGEGRILLGKVKGSNCRHEYGLMFMRQTHQTRCAYCRLDLTSEYRNWLQMSLDHVIPVRTEKAKSIPTEWLEDSSNKVLACLTCNTFQNRYKLENHLSCPQSLDEFFDLRDRLFTLRRKEIALCHQKEQEFYEKRAWLLEG